MSNMEYPHQSAGFYCPACQAINPFEARYCKKCGRPLPNVTTNQVYQTQIKVNKHRSATPWILSVVALLMVIVLVVGLWKPGFMWILVDDFLGDQANTYTVGRLPGQDQDPTYQESNPSSVHNPATFEEDWQQDYVVSSSQSQVTIKEVSLDFGDYVLEEEEDLEVIAYELQEYEEGLAIAAFDISLNDRHELYDVIKISLPYDVTKVDQAHEAASVGAKYFNEDIQEWEDVVYTVDTETKKIHIETNHLSKYSVFMVRNEQSRMAYISTVFAPPIRSDQAQAIVQEYIDNQGQPGPLAENAGWDVVDDYLNVSNVNNLSSASATLKGFQAGAPSSYAFELTSDLGSLTRWVGLGMTFYTLANDGIACQDDHTKRKMVTNVTKNLMFNAVDFFGTSAMQVSFIGLIAIDYALTSFGETMLEERLKNVETVYRQYYKQPGIQRSLKDWRKRLIGYIEANPSNPQEAMNLLEEDIQDYAGRFWKDVNTEEYNALAGEAGLKIASWPNSRDQEKVQEFFISQIHKDLHPVYTSVQNYLKHKVQADALRRLGDVRRYLNQKIQIKIIDITDEQDKNLHADYIIRFEPLSEGTNENSWAGVMKEEGEMYTQFTLLGHIQSGMPDRLAFYKPGDRPGLDAPEFSIGFKVNKPLTIIEVQEQKIQFEDILGSYDITQSVEGFESSMLDSLVDQMEGVPELDDYLAQYESAMLGANGQYIGWMDIEKIGENRVEVRFAFEETGKDQVALYEGQWEQESLRLTLLPKTQMAGNSWNLQFYLDHKTIACKGESAYDSELVEYSFSLEGKKISD